MSRIMVVEDNPDLLGILADFFIRHCHQVFALESADDALNTLGQQTPDLAIVDVILPGRSGWDLLGSIRRDTRLKDMPVIMISADVFVESHPHAYLATRIFVKPISVSELIRLAERLITH